MTLACVLGEESGFWTHMLGAVSLGLFWQQSMFIGHDAGHNSITFDRNKDAMIGWCVGNVFNGVGIAWWMATRSTEISPGTHPHPGSAMMNVVIDSRI